MEHPLENKTRVKMSRNTHTIGRYNTRQHQRSKNNDTSRVKIFCDVNKYENDDSL